MSRPTDCFTDAVQDYVKYRPSYPREVLQFLIKECGLQKNHVVADIGSGTGLFSKLLLDDDNTVYGVEPNQAMREAAEDYLKNYPHFHNINGTAEATSLPGQGMDFVTAGTAFHWFDIQKTKIEFRRILKHSGWVILVWNVRDKEHSALLHDYEELLLTYGKNYKDSRAQEFDQTAVAEFFSPNEMKIAAFNNQQQFDWEGFKGRLLSTSYSLRPGAAQYEEMLCALKSIFDRHQKDGSVEFLYSTKLYYGRIHEHIE